MKPVLFVTGHAPFDRRRRVRPAERARGRRVRAVRRTLAAWPRRRRRRWPRRRARPAARGRRLPSRTATSPSARSAALAASGRYRAVVCSTGGRVALPAAWAGARRARVAADPVDLAVGAPAQRGAPRSATWPCDASTAPPTRSSPTGRTSAPTCGRAARATSTSRRSRSTTPSGAPPTSRPARDRARRGRRGRRRSSCLRDGRRGKRVSGCLLRPGEIRALPRPPPRSSSSAWDPPPLGPRRRRGAAGSAVDSSVDVTDPIWWARTPTAARPLRGRRRLRRAFDSHPHLPRAVGVGGQRGHEPEDCP